MAPGTSSLAVWAVFSWSRGRRLPSKVMSLILERMLSLFEKTQANQG